MARASPRLVRVRVRVRVGGNVSHRRGAPLLVRARVRARGRVRGRARGKAIAAARLCSLSPRAILTLRTNSVKPSALPSSSSSQLVDMTPYVIPAKLSSSSACVAVATIWLGSG